jgi:hypothetical protein
MSSGSVYIIELGADRIKVGWSSKPANRLKSHRALARAYGPGAGREWTGLARAGFATEAALVEFCAARATEQIGREYFVGVPFEDAVEYATTLVAPSPPRHGALQPMLLANIPDGATQRFLDVLATADVIREPGVAIFIVEDDGSHRQVLAGDAA